MNVAPFFRIAAGVSVTPEIPSATGNYLISTEPGGKQPSNFPGADRVVSGKFWPLNANGALVTASPTNLLRLSLDPLTTTTYYAHENWVCYGGWNISGLDADGVSVVGVSRPPILLAMYNRTPYVLSWALTNTSLATGPDLNLAQRLLPGACIAFEGAPQPTYYFDSGTSAWRYNTFQGVAPPGAFLHVKATGNAPSYDRTTAAPNNGYLEIVIAQAATAYWLP